MIGREKSRVQNPIPVQWISRAVLFIQLTYLRVVISSKEDVRREMGKEKIRPMNIYRTDHGVWPPRSVYLRQYISLLDGLQPLLHPLSAVFKIRISDFPIFSSYQHQNHFFVHNEQQHIETLSSANCSAHNINLYFLRFILFYNKFKISQTKYLENL